MKELTVSVAEVAAINDCFRRAPQVGGVPGHVDISPGVSAMPFIQLLDVFAAVRDHSVFTESMDPTGRHEFGGFVLEGVGPVCWRIEYLQQDRLQPCLDPAACAYRVLSIMLAHETARAQPIPAAELAPVIVH